ncbi:MAG: glycosyltransferase family 39 protein [Desulfatitalea sp.]|nr:glycosyltransferase family 39 protein [Desulfatitalea sp.]NNK01502.1 glycosyltransferase family 39 protein [Desulfatitalea sp.]
MNTENLQRYAYGIVLAACLAFYLPGLFSIPAVDRDESRYAQASRQMLEDRDFVHIRFQDEPRNKKPVGIYWLQAAVVAATGTLADKVVWPFRLPSVVGAMCAVFMTLGLGRRLFDPYTAFWGSLLLASSVLMVVEAHMATTDAVLLATVVASQGALAVIYTRHQAGRSITWRPGLLFWAAQGIGILIKGPVTPLISILTMGMLWIWDRRLTWARHLNVLVGLPLAIAIVLPWFLAMGQGVGGSFIGQAVTEDLLPKLISGHESHGFVPGYYLLLVMATFWPGCFYLLPGLWLAWKDRRDPALRFLLAWLVPTWLFFELMPTKLPHYVLPTYPVLALFTARALTQAAQGRGGRLTGWQARVGLVMFSLVLLVFCAGAALLPYVLEARVLPAGILIPAAGAALLAAFWRYVRQAYVKGVTVSAVLASAVVIGGILQFVFPALGAIWPSREIGRVVAAIEQDRPCADLEIWAVGFDEPSLVFHLGTHTRISSPVQAAERLKENPDVLVIVRDQQAPAFKDHLVKIGGTYRLVDVVRGYDYTKGRRVTLNLFCSGTALVRSASAHSFTVDASHRNPD